MAKDSFPAGRISFDFETTSLDAFAPGARIFLGGVEDEAGNVIMAEPGKRGWDKITGVLADKAVEKEGWNVNYDLLMGKAGGLIIKGKIHDGMLKAYMNNEYEPDLKLKGNARRHLGDPGDEEKEVKSILASLRRQGKKDANYSDVPRSKMLGYLEKDLDDTTRLGWKNKHVETGPQRRVYEIETELIPNVVNMEYRGIKIDIPYCKKAVAELGPRLVDLEKKLYKIAGCRFNQNSPAQLSKIMLSLGLDTGIRSKPLRDGSEGPMATGVLHLRNFESDPFVQTLLEWRCLHKLSGTYFEAFIEQADRDGIIHPSFWPFGQEEGGIKTGRFSMTHPNFQNIPAGKRSDNMELKKNSGLVRRVLVPRPGYVFLLGDYKQIEFVIFACDAGDEGLLEDLRKGMDFHTANAYRIFGKGCFDGKTPEQKDRIRFQAKELNFSFMYGMGINKFALRTGRSLTDARAIKNTYFSEIPAARDFLLRSQADLLRDGFVQDQFGRRYHVPKDLCYKAANALCQGPAALVMKRGINRVSKFIQGLDAYILLTIHDELILEVRREHVWEAAKRLEEGMMDKENFPVPINVDLAVAESSWADKKKWEEVEAKWKPKRTTVVMYHR